MCTAFILIFPGAYHIFEYPRVLVDVSDVAELRRCYLDQNLVVGGATTLTDLMRLLADTAGKYQEFRYLQKLYEHLNLVAHIPVRNVNVINQSDHVLSGSFVILQ